MNLPPSTERILAGNILFIVCCAFYLAWWLLSFRPVNPVVGMKTGWLLIPAALAGVAAVICIIWGVSGVGADKLLFPSWYAIVGWIAGYVVLAVGTWWLFDRPVTSELLLITGWGALALAQVSALAGSGLFSRGTAIVFVVVVAVVIIASLVCYVLYYGLDPWPSYIDGMIPLILTALTLAAISVCMAAYARA